MDQATRERFVIVGPYHQRKVSLLDHTTRERCAYDARYPPPLDRCVHTGLYTKRKVHLCWSIPQGRVLHKIFGNWVQHTIKIGPNQI